MLVRSKEGSIVVYLPDSNFADEEELVGGGRIFEV